MKNLIPVLLLLALYSCDESTTINNPTEPDFPSNVRIFTTARVIGGEGIIKCEDSSTTIPENQASTIEFIVRLGSGDSADSGTAVPGGQITFSGLEPGTYSVEQTVFLKDQTRGPTKVHNNVPVT